MALRSNGRNLSFEILSRNSSLDDQHDHAIFHRSNSDPVQSDQSTNAKSARRKRKKKKKTPATAHASIPESPTAIYGVVSNSFDVISETTNRETGDIHGYGLEFNYSVQTVLLPVTTEVVDPEFQSLRGTAELRQRTVIGSGGGVVEETETASSRIEGQAKEESAAEGGSASKQRSELSGNVIPKLQTAESLDWKRLMAEDPNREGPFASLVQFLFSMAQILNFSPSLRFVFSGQVASAILHGRDVEWECVAEHNHPWQ